MRPRRPATPPPKAGPVRLQKFLADAGLASRRAGEQLILAGRVAVNGEVVRELGTKVDAARDRVTLDRQPVRARRKVHLAFHKPRGYVCSRADEHGRPTIHDLLPAEFQELHSVGRLDFNSEGLIFLTNDGDFTLRLTHPRYGVRKLYVATVSGRVTPEMLVQLTGGVYSEGERLQAEQARLLNPGSNRSIVELTLAEGRKREVRRMFETLGLSVQRLVRTQIGGVTLAGLKLGRWRPLTSPEISALLSPP